MEHNKVDDDVGYVKADDNKGEEMVDDDMGHKKVGDNMGQEKVDDVMEYKTLYLGYVTPHELMKQSKVMQIKDVVRDKVLPFLPAKALVRFRSVSKEWDRWIKNPFLAHQQSYYFKDLSGFFCQYAETNHTFVTLDHGAYGVPMPYLRFLPEAVDILSSCNGLLLCHGRDSLDPYYVCNPATRQWTELPLPELPHGTESATILAFEPSVLNMGAQYKLICAVPMFGHVLFELYSSGTKSWKVSGTILVEMEDSIIKGNGFYMKGIAYMETSTRKVIAFHLSTELYEVISLPPETPPDGVLTQIQGELCYIGISRLLNNEYSIRICTGIYLSLEHHLVVKIGPESDILPRYQVLPCLDGQNVMILVGSEIYSYSMSDQSIKLITRVGIVSPPAKYLAYVNSLVEVA